MILNIQGHTFHFELENISRLFLPQEKIQVVYGLREDRSGVIADTILERAEADTLLICRLRLDDFDRTLSYRVPNDHPHYRGECELRMAELLYRLFTELFGVTHGWGLITGVRPVKLLRREIRENGEEKALDWMRNRLLVKEDKLRLCWETLKAENKILELSRPESFSLYVSVPFCPTRCDYCSFVSQTVEKASKLIPQYVELLCKEIAYTGELADQLGLRLETVYFGGGTPTTLSADQLAQVTRAVEASFDLSRLREYTVEAGRPDTVTEEKFRALKAAGVTRVSINPQTLRQTVLDAIGRRHTVEQFYDAYDLARRCGFGNVNTDLIAGLPGDDFEGFCGTLEGILQLDPESVTIHTLSMKRASNLVIQKRADYRAQDDAVRMVSRTMDALPCAGYHPYYLYRQSRMVGNQENVGWARPGYEGLYNVYIMDETHTILACGAGAVTKLKQPGTDYLERVFNYKFPYEYNREFGEMLSRKQQIKEFYQRIRAGEPGIQALA